MAEFDGDFRLLVAWDFDLDFVSGLGLADVGAIATGDVGIAEERGVEVEEWMIVEVVKEGLIVTAVQREER